MSSDWRIYEDQIGNLLVKYDQKLLDNGFELGHAKKGDVGIDIPVIVDDRLKLEPHQDYYINKKEGKFDIPPMGVAEIPCGLSIKCPDDAWVNIKPRSSTLWRKRLVVAEAVIDSGYIGPLFILVTNPNREAVTIHEFDRLAQLILMPKYKLEKIIPVSELPSTERADTGFGSSGGIKEAARQAPG